MVSEGLGMESPVIDHPVAASDPKRPRNEEGEVAETPQQAEGQPASSGPYFCQ
jgi:hypothetical protein